MYSNGRDLLISHEVGGGSDEIVNKHGHSETGGVKPMGIQGRMRSERERMLGMTDGERAWRAQWVKDQHLHGEPIMTQEYYKERYNIIRRFYRAPLNLVESKLVPLTGPLGASVTRHIIAKMGFLILGIYSTHYYFKYNRNDWTRKSGWKVITSKIATYPGDKGYPNVVDKKPNQYATFGFENSPI